MKKALIVLYCCISASILRAEDGYRLWLRYDLVNDKQILQQYRQNITAFECNGNSPTLLAAKEELATALLGLLGKSIPVQATASAGAVVAGTPVSSKTIANLRLDQYLAKAGKEGFVITT